MQKKRPVSPVNGQPVPDSPASKEKRFKTGDKRASDAGKRSVEVRREKADLRKLAAAWMETDVGKDKEGKPMTGAQMMVMVAAKEISKGNPRFWELLRDTAGFKPVDKVMISEVEQSVIEDVERMVNDDTE